MSEPFTIGAVSTFNVDIPTPSLDVPFAPEAAADLVGSRHTLTWNGQEWPAVVVAAVVAPDGLSMSATLETALPMPDDYTPEIVVNGE